MADQTLGQVMAAAMPRTTGARCPKCGGRLTATVSAYLTVPVNVEELPLTGERRARYGRPVLESMREIEAQIDDNVGGVEVDERDDIYCENYSVKDGCDYSTRATELEWSDSERGSL